MTECHHMQYNLSNALPFIFFKVPQEEILAVIAQLNSRPRKILGYETPEN